MAIKRRKFLGIGLSGFAGLTLPEFLQSHAGAAAGNRTTTNPVQTAKETTYWDRTERFEEKLKLLEAAWQRKDFRMTRALTHSLRSTAIQAQAEEEDPGTPLMAAAQFHKVESLPAYWRSWAEAGIIAGFWSSRKRLAKRDQMSRWKCCSVFRLNKFIRSRVKFESRE